MRTKLMNAVLHDINLHKSTCYSIHAYPLNGELHGIVSVVDDHLWYSVLCGQQ